MPNCRSLQKLTQFSYQQPLAIPFTPATRQQNCRRQTRRQSKTHYQFNNIPSAAVAFKRTKATALVKLLVTTGRTELQCAKPWAMQSDVMLRCKRMMECTNEGRLHTKAVMLQNVEHDFWYGRDGDRAECGSPKYRHLVVDASCTNNEGP